MDRWKGGREGGRGRTKVLAQEKGEALGGGVCVISCIPEDEDMECVHLREGGREGRRKGGRVYEQTAGPWGRGWGGREAEVNQGGVG